MKKYVSLALMVWTVCAPMGAHAQPAAKPPAVVTCSVQGHDLVLYNRSKESMSAGITIQWSAWNGRREGVHTLTEPLEPDVGLTLSSALGASYFWDRPCEARVAPVQDELERNGHIHLQGGQGNGAVVKPSPGS